METKNIQEFLALAELGSSYVAAEKLFVSQSTLVRHIQAIEEEFGVPLFDRTRKGFVLNDAGQIFLPYARKIALAQAQCYKALNGDDGEPNLIRLASDSKIIDVMIDFQKEFPQYSIEYHKGENLEKDLLAGKFDIAFLSNITAPPEEITSVPFCKEEVLVVLYEDHPLAHRESVRLEELRKERFIGLCEDIVFDESFRDMFGRVGFYQNMAATVPTGSDMMRMVKDKLGISVIHGVAKTTSPYPGIKCIPLDPGIEYDIRMCYRSQVPLPKAAEHFVTYTKKWRILHKDLDFSLFG